MDRSKKNRPFKSKEPSKKKKIAAQMKAVRDKK